MLTQQLSLSNQYTKRETMNEGLISWRMRKLEMTGGKLTELLIYWISCFCFCSCVLRQGLM